MSIDTKLRVTEIQRFCMHDGDGIRTTVFLKGCPLGCLWCHNPETQRTRPEILYYDKKCISCGACATVCLLNVHSFTDSHEMDRDRCISCGDCTKVCPTAALSLCGTDMSIGEILKVVKKDSAFYGDLGGLTVSGGEPFIWGDKVISLFRLCKESGISTAVETCGFADTDVILRAAPFVDLFLWDIKDTDEYRHIKYTGGDLRRILGNLKAVNELGARIRIRAIIVRGVNSNKEHYEKLAKIASEIGSLDGVELIPYHAYAGSKSVFIGRQDSGRIEWIPSDDDIAEARRVIESHGVRVL